MAETMGGAFSSLKDIKYNPNDLLWQLSTFRAGVSNAISTLIPAAPVARSGTVFLEKGSNIAGLTHIWMRHGPQFAQLCKVTSEHPLQQYLYDVMSRGLISIWAYKPIQGGGLKIVYKLPGLFLHVIMGSNGFIVTAYPTTKPESHCGSRGYTLSSQRPGLDIFKWQAPKFDDRFNKWNNRITNNPSTYTLRRTTSLYNRKPRFNYMPTRRYHAMPKRYNTHNLRLMRPRG
jgi:hypothetical protein